ncbi:unnamed protein product [Tilletia controversa]|uniref:Aminopeptidase n=2 Tax=Tilletia TaxID=13289 RepID=A0A177VFN1_9BASI|nr:hypothetical protein CF335_g4568 [Tilletia laevis]KAE8257772.1 hypothetical protein A4X03_0g4570 [Tilletia caries]CAD6907925.1 unnamed protein product [Tilletia controversa]CAD6892010.1 unnamed protein product [Tilletia caries]CAD6903818.1 unnamed protein product [Tilletia caries]
MTSDEQESRWFRLPEHIKPLHYHLLIKTDLNTLEFQGVVTIRLHIEKDVKEIEVNCANLNLSKAHLILEGSETNSTDLLDVVKDDPHGRITVHLGRVLHSGSTARLSIAFWAPIADDLTGYYRSSSDENGVNTTYALTQFAPASARRVFPCWDEPGVKVPCSFSMIHRANTVALANMPVHASKSVDSSEQKRLLRGEELHMDTQNLRMDGPDEGGQDDWILTEFEEAPKMSSYLLTWANGPFQHLESSYTSIRSGKTIPLRIYATASQISQAQSALDIKAKALPVYEQLFDLDFPLPKLDTLVVSDFAFGAMEGFGLITGRTTAFLFDPDRAGLAAQRRAAETQIHEVAHQWFGNMITFVWWNSLWLNESFATLMGSVIVLDRLYPEWKAKSIFINSQLARALDLDAKRSSHPIEVPLRGENVEDGLNQIFDAISYAKGASVLNMLSSLVGQDTFLKGVSIYLKKYVWGNAVTEDLWSGISEASGIDIGKVMGPWIYQQGFPVITAIEQDNAVVVRQNRFLLTGDVKPEEDETLWYIPLALRTVDDQGQVQTDQSVVLDSQRELVIPLKEAKSKTWKLNADTIGVYRVAYSPERLSKLGAEAAKRTSAFSLEDRVGLVSDASTLAKAGYGRTSAALNLVWALREEPTYVVNDAIATTLSSLSSVWFEQPKEVRDGINHLRASIFGPVARRLGFDLSTEESSEIRDLRQTVITAAVAGQYPWAKEECQRRFAPLLDGDDDSLIPKDLMQIIFQTAARLGGVKEFEALLRVYRTTPIPSQKIAALLGLCASSDPSLLSRTADMLFSDDSEIRQQDWLYVFAGLAENPISRRSWWAKVQTHFEEVYRTMETSPSFSRVVESCIGRFSLEEDLEAVEAYFKNKETSRYSMGLQQGLDSIRSNARWLKRDGVDVAEWLRGHHFLS